MKTTRDLEKARSIVESWLRARHPAGAALSVGPLVQAEQGFSGELLMFDVSYQVDGVDHVDGMVLRVEPGPENQLFLDTAFEEQYRAMDALARNTGAPVPTPVGFESDDAVLGSRFYVMSKSSGQTGALWLEWMAGLSEDELERTWWSGLEAMAEMHRADPKVAGLDFLEQPERGRDSLDQLIQYNREYYDWVREGETRVVIEAAYDWLVDNKPDPLPPVGFVWGDAKRGNLLYADDMSCTAVLDFEMMSLGPAEMDLGYWIEGEYQTAEMMGMKSPTVEETVARYGKLLGRDIANLDYYVVLAAFRIAVLRVKLWVLRAGEEFRGDRYDGDRRLALVLERVAGIQVTPA